MYGDILISQIANWAKAHITTSTLLVALSVCCFLHWFLNKPRNKKKLNLPPGPWLNLPFFGYLLFLGSDYIKGFKRLQKIYGPVFRLKLGERSVVVLNDFPSMKEAFYKNAFLGRPPNPPNHLLDGVTSFSVNNGLIWREQRRFALHVMRDLGFGKTRMETHIKEEVAELVNELQKFNGEAVSLRRYLSPSTSNNISALIFGRRMDYHDPKRLLLDNVITELIRFFRPTSVHAWFPWLKDLLTYFKLWDYDKLKFAIEELMQFVDKEISEHQSSLDPNCVRDYMDGFLMQMKEKEYKSTNTSFTREMLKGNVPSLIGAGSVTVRSTVEWTLLCMAEFQDVQKKIHDEIDDRIGRERTSNWLDHTDMPYLNAVLMEVQRWRTVVPINLLRYALEDGTVGGYDIPEGTTVIANLHAVHTDPEYWDDPDTFRPERFLSPDGKEVVKHESWIPFTMGKRACPGETLANVELFLYSTSLLQKFHIKFPEGKRHNFEGNLGAVFAPKPYELCLIARN